MLRKTILSAAMLLARNDVSDSRSGGKERFTMKVDGVDQSDYNVMIVKEEEDGRDFFSLLAYQGDFIAQEKRPSVWLSVNAEGEGTYAIHKRLNEEGGWALYNEAGGSGFSFVSSDPKKNKGFVSTCGAITISKIDKEHHRISGKFQFNASNAKGKVRTISEGTFVNLNYFEKN